MPARGGGIDPFVQPDCSGTVVFCHQDEFPGLYSPSRPLFRFLHAADLHLDSPLRGLERYDGAPVEAIRQATRRAVENLVDLAITERVAFVVIAGDVYDGDWPDYNTGLFFSRQMAMLGDAGIAVYLISGNHDADSVISRSLTLPENVYTLRTDRPESRRHEPTDCLLHGQGFATRAVTTNLSENYPAADRGCFNIGLLHTSASGSPDHEPYAPCTVEGLKRLGYDYWALGHIHLRQTLCENGSLIAFSGNTQGRHVRETGPKGCLLVTVDDGTPTAEFRPLDVFRWEQCTTSARDCTIPEEILDAVAEDLQRIVAKTEGRPAAVRINVVGPTDAHEATQRNADRWTAEIQSAASRRLGEQVWIERVRFATTPPDDAISELLDGPLADLREHLANVRRDDDLLKDLATELADLKRKLPLTLAAELDDVDWLRTMADDAERLLFTRLASPDDTP